MSKEDALQHPREIIDPIILKLHDDDDAYHEYHVESRKRNIGCIKEILIKHKSWWQKLPAYRRKLFIIEGSKPYPEPNDDWVPQRMVVLSNRPESYDD